MRRRTRRRSAPERAATAIATRASPLDLVLLVPPALLLAVYSLPDPAKTALSLSYLDPTATAMYVSHFVHHDPVHLATNVLLYLVTVPLAAALSALCGRRLRFYAVFVVVIGAFPVALSAVNVSLARPHLGYGFSGVDMAFLGILAHAVGWYARDRLPGENPVDPSPVLFFAATAVIAAWAVPPSPASLLAAAGSLLAGAVYLRAVDRSVPGSLLAALDRGAREWRGFGLALAAALLVVLLPLSAFPPVAARDGSVLNVFLHLLGFCFGYVVPFAAFHVFDVERPTARAVGE